MVKLVRALVLFALTFFSVSLSLRAWAQEEAAATLQDAEQAKEAEKSNKSWEQKFIVGNIAVSEWLDTLAEKVDLFLTGKKLTTRQNETNVRIESSTFVVEREGVSNSGSINVNLRLPNLEEYWQLKFSNYDENEDRKGIQRGDLRTVPRERNYGATLGLFRKLGNVRTAFQPRIGLQNPLKVSHSLSFESSANYQNSDITPKLEFFANPDRGTGFFPSMNVHFQLSHIFSLTLINEGEYDDKTHLFSVTNGFSFGQGVTDRSSLSYNLIFGSVNQPSYRLDSYSLSMSWSHLLYRKMLDYRITPHLDFLNAKGYEGVPALTFTIGLTI